MTQAELANVGERSPHTELFSFATYYDGKIKTGINEARHQTLRLLKSAKNGIYHTDSPRKNMNWANSENIPIASNIESVENFPAFQKLKIFNALDNFSTLWGSTIFGRDEWSSF